MDLDLVALVQKEIAVKKQKAESGREKQNKANVVKNQNKEEQTHDETDKLSTTVQNELKTIAFDTAAYTIQTSDFQDTGNLAQKSSKYLHKIILHDLPLYYISQEKGDVAYDHEHSDSAIDEADMAKIKETKINLFPLLMQLRSNTLEPDLLVSLSSTLFHLQQKQEKQCLESYMKLSIGNLSWPIGVENIGIHSRVSNGSGNAKKRSNILISDATRLWITTVKRLITIEFALQKATKN
ncbi:hypothetical protein ACO0QE_004681 [Hanseniaspora vineae]